MLCNANACATSNEGGSLTSLNLSDNDLRVEGTKRIAAAIKVNVSALLIDVNVWLQLI